MPSGRRRLLPSFLPSFRSDFRCLETSGQAAARNGFLTGSEGENHFHWPFQGLLRQIADARLNNCALGNEQKTNYRSLIPAAAAAATLSYGMEVNRFNNAA